MSLEKKEMFLWKEVHEKALITEVLAIEQHQFKHVGQRLLNDWTR